MAAPAAEDAALIAIGVLAVGLSAPLITATAAPALAIAFWRNAFGTLAVSPFALARHWRDLVRMDHRARLASIAAGVLLAVHFGTWVPSLRYTSVASSVALAATSPVWAALLARLRGHAVPNRAWLGMALALGGVVLLTGIDRSVSQRALAGDVLALAGGIAGAGYMTIGGSVRQHVSTTTYTTICYGTCAVLLLTVCVVGRQPLAGYSGDAWIKIVALTVAAQLLGHTLFNRVLRSTSATVVALAILFEVPCAAVIAAAWLGQRPPLTLLPAAALLLAGIATVIWSRTDEPAPITVD